MDYPVTFQEVLRAVIEKRVREFGRAEVARRLGFKSTQALDYLRRGYRGGPSDRKPNLISFEHLQTLAKSEGVSLEDILKEVFIATAALETAKRAQIEREQAVSEALTSSPIDEWEP
jgi:hypothetical protein